MKANKLQTDLIFNYVSLGILAISGILMNIVVVRIRGAASLGVFSQLYAIYIIASQLAVGGVQYSVLRKIAQCEDKASRFLQLIAGIFPVLVLSSLIFVLVFSLRQEIGSYVDSPEVGSGLAYLAPALVFFAVNKLNLAFLNGLNEMKVFAILQATRYVVLVGVLTYLAELPVTDGVLALSFLVAESVVLVLSTAFCWVNLVVAMPRFRDFFLATAEHIRFGIKGVLSGVFLEANTRIDVLMLGVFLEDAMVGIYGFAAMFAEGIYQVVLVVKNIVNPRVAKCFLGREPGVAVSQMFVQSRPYLYLGVALVSMVGVAAVLAACLLTDQWAHSVQVAAIYGVLSLGLVAASAHIPYEGVLLQGNRPAWYTVYIFCILVTNLVLNIVLIPVAGVMGAAIATSIASFSSIFYLSLITRRIFNFRLRFLPWSSLEKTV